MTGRIVEFSTDQYTSPYVYQYRPKLVLESNKARSKTFLKARNGQIYITAPPMMPQHKIPLKIGNCAEMVHFLKFRQFFELRSENENDAISNCLQSLNDYMKLSHVKPVTYSTSGSYAPFSNTNIYVRTYQCLFYGIPITIVCFRKVTESTEK